MKRSIAFPHSSSLRASLARFAVRVSIVAAAQLNVFPVNAGERALPAASKETSVSWSVPAGSSLRESLEGWSEAAGWTVVWDSMTDYRIRVSATFSGSFENAVSELVFAVHLTNPELSVTLYRGNMVLHAESSVASN